MEDRKALPPGQQATAVKQLPNAVAAEDAQHKPVSTDDFYEVVDDE